MHARPFMFSVLVFGLAACPSPPESEDGALDTEVPTLIDDIDISVEIDSDTNVTADPCVLGCDDGNPCTDDRCGDFGCEHLPNVASCDDGNSCTVSDRCTSGLCRGLDLRCDDDNPCTRDICVEGSCEYRPVAGACDDRNACTVGDTCVDGECIGVARQCPDAPCMNATCDPRSGCSTSFADGPCDDGNACTRGDTCQDGHCRGTIALCDDGNPCTDDYCDTTLGCVHRNNRVSCDDGDLCTTADRCLDGECQGGPSAGCCVDDAECVSDDPCRVQECHDGMCVSRPACDDADSCTLDQCDVGECHAVAWTALVAQGTTTVDDFESGVGAWHFESNNPDVGWSFSTTWSASGETSLYLGNPVTNTYDHGTVRAAARHPFMLPPGRVTAVMTAYADLGDPGSCLYDALEVALVPKGASNRFIVGRLCSSGHGTHRFPLDLPAGEYDLELRFDTRDDLDNHAMGVFVDDLVVEVEHTCP